jgi:hypothetical protein
MSKWLNATTTDLRLTEIAKSDGESICNAQPATYFQACHPVMWIQSTAYVIGDLRRPPTINGYIYECTAGGTSGTVEPGWGVVQDGTFTDGTVTWKTHVNYSLAYSPLDPSDKVIGASSDPVGRKLSIGQKVGVVTHRAGAVSHTALIENGVKKLHAVTTAETTLAVNDDVEAGRTTIFFAFDLIEKIPV